jgi:DNA (cytosine-5)-methyltransferase 1
MLIPDIIKDIMYNEGLTQIDFAKKIECTQTQVSEWVNGNSKPNYENLQMIGKVFKIDGNTILDIEEKPISITKSQKKITVVDLFAGVGGLSYGFTHNENFNVILANEFNKDIAKAYTLNHPDVKMLACDIKDLSEEILKKELPDTIDIVVGGPPCQSYSTLGKRQNDDRAHLFEEYCRILTILKPKMFLFENVTGILSMNGGNLFKEIRKCFEDIGYELKSEVLNAADYGIPEIRERVILVGTKGKNTFTYPTPTHGNKLGLKPYVTLEDALCDLPVLESGEENSEYATQPQNEFQRFVHDTDKLKDNQSPKNGEHLIKLMKALPDGGCKDDLPIELRPKSGYGNTYAKMWWKKPAPTITRNFACPSSSRCIHPRDSRALSTREGARLQSFPDSYKFYGSTGTKHLEIGNAVPPLLSIALAKQVSEFFNENKDKI